jgi:hypothetical protein
LVSLLVLSLAASAQDEMRPAFAKLRYEEDWSFLRDPAQRTEPLDELKFIALNADASRYLSLGGEARWHYDYTDDPAWGADPQDPDGVFLQRYLLHGDLHLGQRLRLFGQLYSALESGRAGATAPIDENRLDLQQAFVDIALGGEEAPVLRAGRQEMAYGSSRLIDVREGPNVRRTFEGVRLLTPAGGWRFDAIATRPVRAEVGSFDDEIDNDQALWGIYATHPGALFFGGSLDAYYLGYRRQSARFEQGTADELRHTLGARLWGEHQSWDWNWEVIAQGGHFGDGRIAAWSLATDTGYTWSNQSGQPRVGLSANVASGDEDPDDADLQSFNAMFPRGNYFSELALLGPRNFFNLHPSIGLQPVAAVTVTADIDFFWRLETEDGVYGPGGGLLRGAQGSDERFVGTEVSLNATWDVNGNLALTAIYSHFRPGAFIRDTGPASDIDYVELTAQAKF